MVAKCFLGDPQLCGFMLLAEQALDQLNKLNWKFKGKGNTQPVLGQSSGFCIQAAKLASESKSWKHFYVWKTLQCRRGV